MRQFIIRLSHLINRNTGYLICAAIVFFGISIVGFQKDNQRLLIETRNTTKNTETIVAKQDETLAAVKQVALDNKLLSEQKTDIIICMLQVPVNQRTTNTVENCRKQVETTEQQSAEKRVEDEAQKQASNSPQQTTPAPSEDTPSPPTKAPQQGLLPDWIPLLGLF